MPLGFRHGRLGLFLRVFGVGGFKKSQYDGHGGGQQQGHRGEGGDQRPPPAALDVFRALDASPWQTFRLLRVPASLPYVVAALKISIPLSLIGAVVAEWMSGDGGVGQIILIANRSLDTASLFAAVVVLAVLAVALTGAVALVERRLLSWHESAEEA